MAAMQPDAGSSAGPGPDSAPETQQHHQQQQQQQSIDPSMVKLTRGTSCVLCQQRKVRCDKNKPCANCVKAGVECKVVPPQPPRRRKKRIQEKDLVDRLKKYEALLAENGVKFDAIGHELKSDNRDNNDDVEELETFFDDLKTTPEASTSPSATSQRGKPSSSIFSLHREFRASEQLLHDSSDEEIERSTIHRAFDKIFSNDDGFPFVFSGRKKHLANYHPSVIHIFQLWQIYIDNINTLLKITHVPSIQGQIVQASSNLDSIPKNIEALMFATSVMAVTSLEDVEVENMFKEPKRDVLGRLFEGLQQALLNAGFMKSNDFICLQAYVLYLYAIRMFVDPRQVFCLIGIAVRIAQRMGLHRDPAGYGLPPFEVEQRRRLWWTIVSYDRRIGEMTGSTITALSSGGDCKLPLNVNDTDLHMDGKEMPVPHNGPTEMLFALTRLEIAMAVASNSNRDSMKVNPDATSAPSGSQSSRSTGGGNSASNTSRDRPDSVQSGPTIKIAGQPDSPAYTFDGFCAHMEGTYLSHCDPKIPLHFFTLTMTRQTLSTMRVIDYLVRLHSTDNPLKEMERENLFIQAVQMIEYDNVVQAADSLKGYKWFTAHHFPFPAYMFLVTELRHRCIGPLVDRAWEAAEANHDLRGLVQRTHSPMHTAFGRLFIKAWDARLEAYAANGTPPPEVPKFVGILREEDQRRRRAKRENRKDSVSGHVEFPRPHDQPQDHQGRGSNTGGRGSSVTMLGDGLSPSMSLGASSSMQDSNDMDWSYLVSTLQPEMGVGMGPGPPMQGFNNFGGAPFGPPGGGGPMGGPPSGQGGNMY